MSIKRLKKSVKESKKFNLIERANLYQIYFLIKFDQFGYIFDLLQSIWNFSIESKFDLIKFVTTIQILVTNSDNKVD